MAKMSALQQEIAKVEEEINVLAQVRVRLKEGHPGNIDSEIETLEQVRARLTAALPPVKTRQPRKKPEVTGATAKPNGKGKQATA